MYVKYISLNCLLVTKELPFCFLFPLRGDCFYFRASFKILLLQLNYFVFGTVYQLCIKFHKLSDLFLNLSQYIFSFGCLHGTSSNQYIHSLLQAKKEKRVLYMHKTFDLLFEIFKTQSGRFELFRLFSATH